jgi:YbbR domain-containing protein
LSIRDKLFSNFGWKIIAILLALVLWFHVATEKIYEKTFPVKIQTIGLRSNVGVQDISPASTDISVVATGKQLLQLMLSDGLTAYIDLSFVSRPGQYEYTISSSNFHDVDASSFRSATFIGPTKFVVTVRPRT